MKVPATPPRSSREVLPAAGAVFVGRPAARWYALDGLGHATGRTRQNSPPAGPAPARPRRLGQRRVALGLALPADYKGVIGRYGAGAFSDLLIVLNPFLPNAYLDLLRGGSQILESARTARDSNPGLLPVPIHPEPGGILPWGVTEAGDTLYWRTEGKPDAWPVVLRRSSGASVTSYPWNVSRFLAEWLGRRSLAAVFGGASDFAVPEFIPFRRTYLLTAFLSPAPGDFETRLQRLMRLFESEHVKTRYQGLQGFNQASFRGGSFDVLVVYLDDEEFGSRLELHVPRSAKQWAEEKLAQVPAALGIPFRRLAGATADFTWAEDPSTGPPDED